MCQTDELRVSRARVQVLEDRLDEAERHELAAAALLGAAHDASNLLMVVRSVLRAELGDGPAREDAELAIERAIGLWTDVRQLARPDRRRERIDLATPVEQVARWVHLLGASVPVVLELHDATIVRAERADLERLVLNLVLNAVQHSPPGAAVRVVVAPADGADGTPGVGVSVIDEGHGLAAEARRAAFAPFHSHRAGGTGVGLTVALAMAERHGGHLELTVASGGGTCARLWLPAAEEPVDG